MRFLIEAIRSCDECPYYRDSDRMVKVKYQGRETEVLQSKCERTNREWTMEELNSYLDDGEDDWLPEWCPLPSEEPGTGEDA